MRTPDAQRVYAQLEKCTPSTSIGWYVVQEITQLQLRVVYWHCNLHTRQICQSLTTRHRLTMSGISLLVWVSGSSILVLDEASSDPGTPEVSPVAIPGLVFVGFSHSQDAEEHKKTFSRPTRPHISDREWLRIEFSHMFLEFWATFGSEIVIEWVEMEQERGWWTECNL